MTRKQEIIDNFSLASRDFVSDAQELVQDLLDSEKSPVLQLNIDATHSGRLTNGRVYPGVQMRKSVGSFTSPSPRPVLKHHNSDQDPIGRVSKAKFVKIKSGKDFTEDYLSPSKDLGSGFIQLDLNIMDQDSIMKFIDGRFKEFSTRQGFDSLLCSICGNNFAEDYCGHHPGQYYEIEKSSRDSKKKTNKYLCYAITGKLKYREVSVVNIAGDDYTGINSLELIGSDSFDSSADFIVTCDSDDEHGVGSIVLANSDGEELNLIAAPGHQHVTAEDRKRLTGKVIVAASPAFKDTTLIDEGEDMPNEDNSAAEDNKETTAVDEKTQNTDDSTTRDEDGKPTQNDQNSEQTEGVVAPDAKVEDGNGKANDDLDPETLRASLTALATSNKNLEGELASKTSEIERLKSTIATKDEELERAQASAADSLKEGKLILARQLLDTKLILGKSEVSEVCDNEAYEKLLQEYTKRSSSSLQDSMSDLSADLTALKTSKGIATIDSMVSDDPVENPVSNKVAEDDQDNKESSKPKTRDQLLDGYLG